MFNFLIGFACGAVTAVIAVILYNMKSMHDNSE